MSTRNSARASEVVMESLEDRQLMSVGTLSVQILKQSGGTVLDIKGTSAADDIYLWQSKKGVVVSNQGTFKREFKGKFSMIRIDGRGGDDRIKFVTVDAKIPCSITGGDGNDTIRGAAGKDTIIGGNGDDRIHGNKGADVLYGGNGADSIYAGAGDDKLVGGGGRDTLVSIGGGEHDSLWGSAGSDSFWGDEADGELVVDAAPDELLAIHYVAQFQDALGVPTSKELDGQDLLDPYATWDLYFKNFSDQPLFAPGGPTRDDPIQGYLGDCWLPGTLAAIAGTDPETIRQSVVDLGDRTYAVQLFNDFGEPVFYRVDGDLPLDTGTGQPYYGRLGPGGSMWFPIIEKAYAFYRYGDGDYLSLEGGNPNEVFRAFNTSSNDAYVTDAAELADWLTGQLWSGKAVTFCTLGDEKLTLEDVPLVTDHCYTVVGVYGYGDSASIVLRNPWAMDTAEGPRDGVNDGYVTVSASEAWEYFSFATSAWA